LKITKIEVSDFRGFPGPAVYAFEFGNARNLFIYGENGSGKSSLFHAVEEFFNLHHDAKPFAAFKNNLDSGLTSGRVTVHFDDGSAHTWALGGPRSLQPQTPTLNTALQLGCLDYRSLLETNFTQRSDKVNIFDIAVNHLVPHLEVPVQGGHSQRIADLWRSVTSSNPDKKGHYSRNLARCASALQKFNSGFQPKITPLIDKATELLGKFPNSDIILGASFQPVEYDMQRRAYKNVELFLSVQRQGAILSDHHNVLNEARLSAIGLVVYLAGLLISVPPISNYPKLLVLDDVLVGLDMENRLPVLAILEEHFSDWQIILLTYDRVWYEMVSVDMETPQHNWGAYELWLSEDGLTPRHRPRQGGPDFFLARASQHFVDNDDRAAAMYTRAAFETKVKSYCEEKSVSVPYKKDTTKIKIESLWQPAMKRAMKDAQNGPRTLAVAAQLRAVNAAKKVVLNPLSHSTPQPITRHEVQSAITAVSGLTFR
jgi:energy-coupling factor transporter ATP-binding protein EcfA2